MKAVFFDIKESEKKFLNNNMPSGIEPVYLSWALTKGVDISKDIKNAEIICVFVSSVLDEEVLKKFTNLKFILTRSVGYSHIDLKYCAKSDIKVFNAPHYGDNTVAEYVFAVLLTTLRHIKEAEEDVKNNTISLERYEGFELFNKTLGVIGAGRIGKNVLDIAHGFKMKTLAFDKNQSGDYNFVELEELFRESDIISINAPLTDETYHLINDDTIKLMKTGVAIVNAARGEIIDTHALYRALSYGKISYAALDVIECEEILCTSGKKCLGLESIKDICLEKFFLNQKLLQMSNVTITPHIAYNTKEAVGRILKMTKENLLSCLNFDYSANNLVLL